MNIRVKPGAWIASINTPETFVSNMSIITDAIIYRDDETDDYVFEFEYNGRMWTVGKEYIEIISDNTPKQTSSTFITPAMTDKWEDAWRKATKSVK